MVRKVIITLRVMSAEENNPNGQVNDSTVIEPVDAHSSSRGA